MSFKDFNDLYEKTKEFYERVKDQPIKDFLKSCIYQMEILPPDGKVNHARAGRSAFVKNHQSKTGGME